MASKLLLTTVSWFIEWQIIIIIIIIQAFVRRTMSASELNLIVEVAKAK